MKIGWTGEICLINYDFNLKYTSKYFGKLATMLVLIVQMVWSLVHKINKVQNKTTFWLNKLKVADDMMAVSGWVVVVTETPAALM